MPAAAVTWSSAPELPTRGARSARPSRSSAPVQSRWGAHQLRQHRRRRSFLRHRQRAPELLELPVHLAETRHVLARLEGLRQLDGDHLLELLQLSLAVLLTEKLAPEKSPLL